MNIDLLPFSAFALESSGAASHAAREAHTLTLPLDLVPVHAAFEPAMSGSISIEAAQTGACKTGGGGTGRRPRADDHVLELFSTPQQKNAPRGVFLLLWRKTGAA